MKKVRKKTRTVKRKCPRKSKEIYRVKNWSSYNESLKARGSLTVWFSEEAASAWSYQGARKRGGVVVYSDLAIKTCLMFRQLYRLPLRQTEGFVDSLIGLMPLSIKAPDYTTISRRMGALTIDLSSRPSCEPLHVAIDSTGLKVYGEGEWLVKKHGWAKHRRWLKVHLAVDADNGAILACRVTTNAVCDNEEAGNLLKQVKSPIRKVSADGLYDVWKVYETLEDPSFQDTPIQPIIPPQKNARIKQHGNYKKTPLQRDEAIRVIRKMGRKKWKRESGYHRRSLAETAMYRYKAIIGDHAKARSLENQIAETRMACAILNKMQQLGTPDAYKMVG